MLVHKEASEISSLLVSGQIINAGNTQGQEKYNFIKIQKRNKAQVTWDKVLVAYNLIYKYKVTFVPP